MLLGADNFLLQLSLFRQAWIKGRLGGGKTLVAFALAKELIRRGMVEGCISNVPHGLPLHPWNDVDAEGRYKLIRKAVIVYDEAWVKLDNRTSMTNDRTYGAFARKLGLFMLFPSVIPIDKRNSYLAVQRVARVALPVVRGLVALLGWLRLLVCDFINDLIGRWPVLAPLRWLIVVSYGLWRSIDWLGEEFWIYRWSVELGYMQDTGTFILARPSEYYNLYDTKYIPLDDGDIGPLYERTILEEKSNDVGAGKWYIEDGEEIAGGESSPAAASPDIYYYPEIRAIAQPFSGRPGVLQGEDESAG